MLIRIFLIISIFLTLLNNPVYTESKECKEKVKKYNEMLNKVNEPCTAVKKELFQLIDTYISYVKNYNLLTEFYKKKKIEIFETVKTALILKAKHDKLIADAGTKGLILSEDMVKKVNYVRENQKNIKKLISEGILDKKERIMFGVPESAMIFDSKQIALLNAYRKKEYEIYSKYEEVRKKALKKLKKDVPRFNKQLNKKLKILIFYSKKFDSLKRKIIYELYNDKYPQCLGYYAGILTLPAGETYNLEYVKVKKISDGTWPEEIPGLKLKVLSIAKLNKIFKNFSIPDLPDLDLPNFKKDGSFYAKQWAGVQRAKLVSEEMDLVINAVDILKGPLEAMKDLYQAVYIDIPKSIVMGPTELVKTAFSFTKGVYYCATGDTDKGLEIMQNSAKKGFNLIISPVVYFYDKGKNIIDNFVKIPRNFPDVTYLTKFEKVKQAYSSYVNAITNLKLHWLYEADPINDPRFPESGSTEDYLNYIDSSKERIKNIKKAKVFLKDFATVTRSGVQILADVMEIDFNLKLMMATEAAGGPKIFKNLEAAKNFITKYKYGSKYYTVLDASALLKQKISATLTKVVQNSVENKAKLKISKRFGKKKYKKLAKRKKLKKTRKKRRKKGSKKSDKASQPIHKETVPEKLELVKTLEKNPEKFAKEIESILKEENLLGEGKIKEAYLKPGSNEVVQVVKEVHPPQEITIIKNGREIKIKEIPPLEREKIGFKRLDEAGVPHLKVSEPIEIVVNGKKKVIRIAELIDKSSIAENIKESGKWTFEHTKALAEALKKLNKKGYIAADINPGNIYFKRNSVTGKLEACFLEADSIIDFRDLTDKKIKVIIDSNFNTKTFDLTTVKGREGLQKYIAASGKGSMNPWINSSIMNSLASEKLFSNIDSQGNLIIPVNSAGVYVDAKYFTLKEFNKAWEIVNFKKISKNKKKSTSKIVEKLVNLYKKVDEAIKKRKTEKLASIEKELNNIKLPQEKKRGFLAKWMKRKYKNKKKNKTETSNKNIDVNDIFEESDYSKLLSGVEVLGGDAN